MHTKKRNTAKPNPVVGPGTVEVTADILIS